MLAVFHSSRGILTPPHPLTGTLPGTRSLGPCKNSFGFIIIHFSCVSDGCRFSGPFVRSRAPESCSDALQSCGSGKFWKMDQRHIQSFFLNLQADSFITCCRASFYFILPLKGQMRIRNPLSKEKSQLQRFSNSTETFPLTKFSKFAPNGLFWK